MFIFIVVNTVNSKSLFILRHRALTFYSSKNKSMFLSNLYYSMSNKY